MPFGVPEPMKTLWRRGAAKLRSPRRPAEASVAAETAIRNLRRERFAMTEKIVADGAESAPVKQMRAASPFQGKDHIHRGFDFNRLAVEQVGPVAPGLHGVQRGLLQHRRAARHAQILDGSCLGDGGRHYDSAPKD